MKNALFNQYDTIINSNDNNILNNNQCYEEMKSERFSVNPYSYSTTSMMETSNIFSSSNQINYSLINNNHNNYLQQKFNSNKTFKDNNNNNNNDLFTLTNNKDSQKVKFPFGKCKICHDDATGVHYGVITCEGCKVSIFQSILFLFFF
jgi:hypothetical protein